MNEEIRLKNKFIDGEIYYLDELDNTKEVWIPKSRMPRYIKSTYNLSSKEYYDLVMSYRGESVGKCKICGKPTRWYNLYKGYAETCSVNCRNMLVSTSDNNIVTVTRSGIITNSVNHEFLTKYRLNNSVIKSIPNGLSLLNLINLFENNSSLWLAGYNGRSIQYAPNKMKNLITNKSHKFNSR
jgi:hypothetical protein